MFDNKRFIGHVGLGYWGKNILRNFYELDILHTACDTDPTLVRAHKKKIHDINYIDSFDKLLSITEIKAIAISTPAVTHYELVQKTLIAGKDVFVEKPLCLTVQEGKELVELAKKENRLLMVGHILQYHPAVIKLKELISAGVLGKLQYIYSNRLNIGKLRTEENILWSFAPHDISVILSLLGEEPIRTSAFGGDYISNGIYDTTMTTLDFKDGVKGHIFVSWLHPFKEQKLIVIGSKAMAVFDDVSKEKLAVYPHKIEWKHGKIPVAQKADYQVIPVENAEPLKEELRHFAECVIERKQPWTDGHEGLRVLKVLEAAENSLKSHASSLSPITNSPSPIIGSFPSPLASHPSPITYSSSPIASRLLPITPIPSHLTSNLSPSVFVHQSSYVDEGVQIGEGTKIWHFSHILKGSKIGEGCIIGQNVTLGPDVTIGDRCKIQNNVSLYKGVTLEDDVFCGPSCVFTNVYNPRAFIGRKHEFKSTLVKKGSTIGANATIVCGITIGQYAMIGAGAVVKSDVTDYAIVAGVPAKQKGWVCKCGTTLKFNNNASKCNYCGNQYIIENNRIVELSTSSSDKS